MSTRQLITVTDHMTIYQTHDQKALLLDALQEYDAVELDLSQVGEIDTAGLQLLLLAKREAMSAGKTFQIIAHSPAVRETIEFANLAVHFGDPLVISAR